jgi:hypothetical protein
VKKIPGRTESVVRLVDRSIVALVITLTPHDRAGELLPFERVVDRAHGAIGVELRFEVARLSEREAQS